MKQRVTGGKGKQGSSFKSIAELGLPTFKQKIIQHFTTIYCIYTLIENEKVFFLDG